jgi:hypothetical protein
LYEKPLSFGDYMRRKAKVIPGIMWVWDREMFMDWKSYDYWMNHALPFGWAVIRAPQNIMEESCSSYNTASPKILLILWKWFIGKFFGRC